MFWHVIPVDSMWWFGAKTKNRQFFRFLFSTKTRISFHLWFKSTCEQCHTTFLANLTKLFEVWLVWTCHLVRQQVVIWCEGFGGLGGFLKGFSGFWRVFWMVFGGFWRGFGVFRSVLKGFGGFLKGWGGFWKYHYFGLVGMKIIFFNKLDFTLLDLVRNRNKFGAKS